MNEEFGPVGYQPGDVPVWPTTSDPYGVWNRQNNALVQPPQREVAGGGLVGAAGRGIERLMGGTPASDPTTEELLARAAQIDPSLKEDWAQYYANKAHPLFLRQILGMGAFGAGAVREAQEIASGLKNTLQTFMSPETAPQERAEAGFNLASMMVGGEGAVGAGWNPKALKQLTDALGKKPPLGASLSETIQNLIIQGPEMAQKLAESAPGTPGAGYAKFALAQHKLEDAETLKAQQAEAAKTLKKIQEAKSEEAGGWSPNSSGFLKLSGVNVKGMKPEDVQKVLEAGAPLKKADQLKQALNLHAKDQGIAEPFPGVGQPTLKKAPEAQQAAGLPNLAPEKPSAGPVIHPEKGESGQAVTIYKPHTDTSHNWHNPNEIATFTPGGVNPDTATFKKWFDRGTVTHEDWKNWDGTDLGGNLKKKDLVEPPFVPHSHLPSGAGVVVMEPGGKRVWIVSPTNGFGDKNVLPKGRVDPGHDMQTTAIKEALEETGLKVRIKDFLDDVTSPYSRTRYYLGERVGGDPTKMGWESQAVHAVPISKLDQLPLNSLEKGVMEKALAKMPGPPKASKAKKSMPLPAANYLFGAPTATAQELEKLHALIPGFEPFKGPPDMPPWQQSGSAASMKIGHSKGYESAPGTSGFVPSFNPEGLPMDWPSVRDRIAQMGFRPLEKNWVFWRGMKKYGPASWSSGQFGYIDPVAGELSEPGLFFHPDISVGGKAGKPVAAQYSGYTGFTNPHLVRAVNPLVKDVKGEHYGHFSMGKAIKDAWAAGHDALLLKNMHDIGGKHDQLIVRYPHMLRHPKAAFSLKYKESPNLLAAGGLPPGLQIPMLVQDEDLREKENAE